MITGVFNITSVACATPVIKITGVMSTTRVANTAPVIESIRVMRNTGVASTTDVKVITCVKKISSVQDSQNLYSDRFVEEQKA